MDPSNLEWAVFMRDDFRCRRCRRFREGGVGLVVDLIVPVSYGGESQARWNLQTLCERCASARLRADGVPAEPTQAEDLHRVLGFPHLRAEVLALFREAALAKENTRRSYSSVLAFQPLDQLAYRLVGWELKRGPRYDGISPEDHKFLCSSSAYDAVVMNILNLLPADS
jgi:hypothetical protein